MEPVFYLMYTSKAVKLMNQTELSFLLEQSRRNNIAANLTGMLLYMEGRFMNSVNGRFIQLLEGAESDVNAMFDCIKADDRHKSILLLAKGEEPKRLFPDWSMGFKTMDENAGAPVAGFFQLNDDFLCRDATGLLKYFHSFYQINLVDGRL